MFINAELDICPAFGWQGGPGFNTRVIATQSWMERRNASNILCRHNYSLPIQNIFDTKYLIVLKQAFLACRGQLHSFKVKDYSDFEVSNEVFAEGDGTEVSFQLAKVSSFGIASYVRIINKPCIGVVIYVDGVETAATVDLMTGIVTFASPPSAYSVLSWTGEFRVSVRFANDALNAIIDAKTGKGNFVVNASVDLIEVFGE